MTFQKRAAAVRRELCSKEWQLPGTPERLGGEASYPVSICLGGDKFSCRLGQHMLFQIGFTTDAGISCFPPLLKTADFCKCRWHQAPGPSLKPNT